MDNLVRVHEDNVMAYNGRGEDGIGWEGKRHGGMGGGGKREVGNEQRRRVGEWRENGGGVGGRHGGRQEERKGGMFSITAVYFTAVGTRNIKTCNKPHNELTQLYL